MAVERPDLKKYNGQKLTVIAWLWARTVKSPNPAYAHVNVPLSSTFMLSTKEGKETYIEPVIKNGEYQFKVRVGKPKDAEAAKLGTSSGKRAAFKCLMSGTPIPYDYIRSEGQAGRMGARLMAIVAEGDHGRVYLPPTDQMEKVANQAMPSWKPDCEMPKKHRNFQPPGYGMNNLGDLFTPRQLVALTTFSDLVQDVREIISKDASASGKIDDKSLTAGGIGAAAYADAIAVYLAFSINKLADRGSTICGWDSSRDSLRNTFGRQAIPMVWDFAEANALSESSGSYNNAIDQGAKVLIEYLPANVGGISSQADAAVQSLSIGKIVSTDPPYYDNIAYADLSDFFYVWLRRSLKPIFPNLFSTLAVPKAEELTAFANRHDGKAGAETFFLDGMTHAMRRLAKQSHPSFPVTIYYGSSA